MSADSLKESINRAERWLLTSGIQNRSSNAELKGGVHAWYDLTGIGHSFLYTEITGYTVTMDCFLHEARQKAGALEAAEMAAKWLLTQARQAENGALLCRRGNEGWAKRACAFDNGMCLNGLLNLHSITGKEQYLDASLAIGNWLLDVMRGSDGLFISKFDTATGIARNPGGKWSLISGAFLIKLAISLLNLAAESGDEKFADAARDLCDWGLTLQEPDGRFRTSPNMHHTFLHPHCYAAEGMIVAGTTLNEPRFTEAAAKAVAWIAPHQSESGGFPGCYEEGNFIHVESPDISAQVLRVWMMLPEERRTSIEIDLPRATTHLLSFQCNDERPEANGGFVSGPAWFHGESADRSGQHVNSWVTMFTAQTLAMIDGTSLSPFLLV